MRPEFEDQLERRGITDRAVLRAMDRVPREEFVPEPYRSHAYADGPLGIGEGQTISQPYIVALMTQSLAAGPGDRVLEVGTGSGYQAAVLAEMGCDVYSVERHGSLSRRAGEALDRLGYGNVSLRVGDGAEGWLEEAPFDAIAVTCAARELPGALTGQLRPGGRMVIPVGEDGDVQVLWLFEKTKTGKLRKRRLCDVRFVPLV